LSRLTLVATGDSIITQRLRPNRDAAFTELMALVRGADAAFTNLEIMVPREPWVGSSEHGGGHQGAPPFILDELKWYGFNLFNVANNHSTDYTYRGLTDTMEALRERGMAFAGGGRSLGEARSPAYLDTPNGRVALVAAASSFVTGALAAERRTDMAGRPGISPLRHEKRYVLDPRRLALLREIDEAMGTAEVARRKFLASVRPEAQADAAYRFLDLGFYEGERPGMHTRANARDLDEICRWIRDARRQADLVIFSLHGHEGQLGESNCPSIADFHVEAAHRVIEAGADVFIGHGPHLLRGIEIYRGKPIFYSLGNFIFQYETVVKVPAEMYEWHQMGPEATPADISDAWERRPDGSPAGFFVKPAFWQTVLPVCRFEDGVVTSVELHPVEEGMRLGRPRRGTPRLAGPDEARAILAGLAELSAPLHTEIAVQERGGRPVGVVRLNV
jgi:poly-gamma-glutamate capsule biosynthesis protein CapA/YwtB (metallophosphatase superfamily)